MADDVQAPVVFQHQYMCSECGQLYNTLEDVLVHQQNHVGGGVQSEASTDVSLELGELQGMIQENQYQCLECGQVLVSPNELLHHQQMHMKDLTQTSATATLGNIHYQCPDCKELFTTPELWVAHCQKHEKNKRQQKQQQEQPQQSVILQAGTGIQALLNLQNVLLDERTLNGWGIEVPTVVGSTENTTDSAAGPQGVINNLTFKGEALQVSPQTYKCLECSQAFRTPEELLDHQSRHNKARIERIYSNSDNAPSPSIIERLRKDWMIDEKEERAKGGLGTTNRIYRCHECNKEFLTAKFLRKHRKDHHSLEFHCPDCDRYFTSANRLQSHRRVHVEGNLQCPNCYRVFKKEASLEQHMRIHRGEALYLCLDCGLGFGTEITLILHRKSHTSDPFHRCHCGKTFSNMTKFLYHRRAHFGKSGFPPPKPSEPVLVTASPVVLSVPALLPDLAASKPLQNGFTSQVSVSETKSVIESQRLRFKCLHCSQAFPTHLELSQHWQVVHPAVVRNHECTVCNKFFNKQIYLQKHMRTHTGKHPSQCADCGKTFSSMANLARHNLVHIGERSFTRNSNLQQLGRLTADSNQFTCKICGLEFNRASKLALHEIRHTSAMPYKCLECGKTFLRKRLMQLHHLEHRGKAPIYCKDCGATFPQESQLAVHVCRSRNLTPYKCPTCGKTLNSSSSLNLHLLLHIGKRPFKCHVCGKTFSSRRRLKKHQRWHPGVRPYKCGVCGRAFMASFSLKLHQRIHMEKQTFSCLDCGKGFRQAFHLKGHSRLHTRERPYGGEDCGQSFLQSLQLEKHKHTHTTDQTHPCPDCGKSFETQATLNSHLKTHQTQEAQPQQTIMCTELGETIAIIESVEPLPLQDTIEIYQAALGGSLQVEDAPLQ